MKIENEVTIPKLSLEWDELDMRKAQLNIRVIYHLHCALNRNEYYRICHCKSAKDIWSLLEITHAEINQIKESNINILMHNYELFTIKDNGFILETFTRVTLIVNDFQALGNVYTKSKKVTKILSSLPKQYETLIIVI